MEKSTSPCYEHSPSAVPFRVLLIEQTADGADYLSHLLGKGHTFPVGWIHVTSVWEALGLLGGSKINGVLLDMDASEEPVQEMISKICAAAPETPVVVLANEWNEGLAKQVIQAGAQDYLLKGQTDVSLLVRSLFMAVERKQGAVAQEGLIHRLWRSLSISGLTGGIEHMCMFCKKFRNEQDQWISLESYLHDHAGMEISHGMCPPCSRDHYPQFTEAR